MGDNSSYRSSNDTPVSPAPSSDKLTARSERQRGGGASAGGRRSPPQPVASPLVSDSADFARPQPVRINSAADTVDRFVYVYYRVLQCLVGSFISICVTRLY